MSTARLLVLSFSNLDADPRVRRQIAALCGHYRVSTCGLSESSSKVERHFAIVSKPRSALQRAIALAQLLSGSHEGYYWGNPMARAALEALRGERFEGVLANDIATLPLALEVASGAPVFLDAHEYAPDEFGDRLAWRVLYSRYNDYLCARYLPRAAKRITVSAGLARLYSAQYGVDMDWIASAPPLRARPPRAPGDGRMRMIHHGAALRSRNIEGMIEVLEQLDERFVLDLMLVPGSPGYIDELKRRAAGNPRIAFPAPAAPSEIVERCVQYDVGLCLLPPVNRSLEFCLPNKFFEFLHAGLAVAIGPSPDMARIVRDFGCGVVAIDFRPASLAAELSRLTTDRLAAMRAGAAAAARAYNAEANGDKLRALMRQMLGN